MEQKISDPIRVGKHFLVVCSYPILCQVVKKVFSRSSPRLRRNFPDPRLGVKVSISFCLHKA